MAVRDGGFLHVPERATRRRRRHLPALHLARDGRGKRGHRLRPERPLGLRRRVHGRGLRGDASRPRREGIHRRPLGTAPAFLRDGRDRLEPCRARSRGRPPGHLLRRRAGGGTGGRPYGRGAPPPGLRAPAPRGARRRVRTGLGDRYRQDRHRRASAGRARLHQEPRQGAGSLRRVRQARERRGASLPAGR
jgi:hypothetical protein